MADESRSSFEDNDAKAESEASGPPYDPSLTGYTGISAGRLESLEDVRSARDLAEMIVDTIREGLLVLDSDLRVVAANESFYKMFDAEPTEALGGLVYELGNGQWDIPQLRRLLEDILPQRKAFNGYEVRHEFEGLGKRVMVLNARQLDAHKLILLAIEDVTEGTRLAGRLRKERERFDLIVRNAVDHAIIGLDEDGHIVTWNPGAEHLFGYSTDEAQGRPFSTIFVEDDREEGAPSRELEKARRTGTARDERWHKRKDGTRFWAAGFVVALREDGELYGYVKILRDDTDKKEAQRALVELNESLERQVAERTRQIRNLASSLTIAEQQERRRLAQVLHDDLQQVLYALKLKIGVARHEIAQGRTEQARERLEEAESHVSDSISVTRGLTVDLSPPFLETETVTDALLWVENQMAEHYGMRVRIEADGATITLDENMRLLLVRVVRELLLNVLEHADTMEAVVQVRKTPDDVEITVADEGKGFDPATVEEQLSETGGFGLMNIRDRLGLFGGGLDLDATPGEGTRVTIRVPLEG